MSTLEADATTKELMGVMSTRFPIRQLRFADVPEFMSYLAETTQSEIRISRLSIEDYSKEGVIRGPDLEEVKGTIHDSQGIVRFELFKSFENGGLVLSRGFRKLDFLPTRPYVAEEDQKADIARFRPYTEAIKKYFTR